MKLQDSHHIPKKTEPINEEEPRQCVKEQNFSEGYIKSNIRFPRKSQETHQRTGKSHEELRNLEGEKIQHSSELTNKIPTFCKKIKKGRNDLNREGDIEKENNKSMRMRMRIRSEAFFYL